MASDDDSGSADTREFHNDPIVRTMMSCCIIAPEAILRGKEGKALAKEIKRANRVVCQVAIPEKPLAEYMNRLDLTREEFDHCLRVYETNQQYASLQEDCRFVWGMEIWFLQVIEPAPRVGRKIPRTRKEKDIVRQEFRDWVDREKTKTRGWTAYCDEELFSKVRPRHLPAVVKDQIHRNILAIETNVRTGVYRIPPESAAIKPRSRAPRRT